jgi:hypothetical protein
MTVTVEILKGLAMQALNMAKTECEQKRFMGLFLATYHEGEQLHRMARLEAMIAKMLGADWLNDGGKKDAAFSLLCEACKAVPPDAIVCVMASNMFRETPKMEALPEERRRTMLDRGHDYHHQLVKEGMLEIVDSMTSLAQSREDVVLFAQEVDDGRFIGQAECKIECKQAQFDGRLKLYKDEPMSPEMQRFLAKRGRV